MLYDLSLIIDRKNYPMWFINLWRVSTKKSFLKQCKDDSMKRIILIEFSVLKREN